MREYDLYVVLWALLAAVSLVGVVVLNGCASPAMVRECGALAGDHLSLGAFEWVQPCGKEPGSGVSCAEECRPAKGACEAVQAEYRDLRNTQRDYERLESIMKSECPPAPKLCTDSGGWYVPCPPESR